MGGTFYGYREQPKKKGATPFWTYRPADPEIRLSYWGWDLLGPTPFEYTVYRGEATDEYSDSFIEFPFMSRLIICTIRDGPAFIRLTYDGIEEQPERRFDRGWARLEAARGFKIRNAEVARICRYQVIVSQ